MRVRIAVPAPFGDAPFQHGFRIPDIQSRAAGHIHLLSTRAFDGQEFQLPIGVELGRKFLREFFRCGISATPLNDFW